MHQCRPVLLLRLAQLVAIRLHELLGLVRRGLVQVGLGVGLRLGQLRRGSLHVLLLRLSLHLGELLRLVELLDLCLGRGHRLLLLQGLLHRLGLCLSNRADTVQEFAHSLNVLLLLRLCLQLREDLVDQSGILLQRGCLLDIQGGLLGRGANVSECAEIVLDDGNVHKIFLLFG